MSKGISKPYTFTNDEDVIIARNYHHKDDWDKSKLKPIKDHLRDFLRVEQHNTCCYCKRELRFGVGQAEIEHIVSRKEYEKYGFEPYNLALSCHECNFAKLDRKVLNIPPIIPYSHQSLNYKIIHPYFDDYDLHIRRFGVLYEALSNKGEVTIDYCKLSRIEEIQKKKFEYMAQNGNLPQKLIYSLLLTRTVSETTQILNKIDKYIKSM